MTETVIIWGSSDCLLLFSATSAPHIFEQPMEPDTAYKSGEEVKLPCVADSDSQPTYVANFILYFSKLHVQNCFLHVFFSVSRLKTKTSGLLSGIR